MAPPAASWTRTWRPAPGAARWPRICSRSAAPRASLPPLTPPDRVWQQIAPRVAAPIAAAPRPAPNWRERLAVPLAIAAVLLAAVAITSVMRQWRNPSRAVTDAVRRHDSGRAGLERGHGRRAEVPAVRTGAGAGALRERDPEARRAGEGSARAGSAGGREPAEERSCIIDQSIDESRAALKVNPANERAQESLFEAFRTKISLLQDTISLINEMRKGNQAEAARIADGLNKS